MFVGGFRVKLLGIDHAQMKRAFAVVREHYPHDELRGVSKETAYPEV